MKHLGDITKINGAEIPVVDCIIGGSPCQDLSVAGKRAGLSGERSGLFMEQIRIIKEMRNEDAKRRAVEFVRPRYMVWENVPGAFSSGNPKGADFQAVLEETVRIVCKEAPPVPVPKDGWPSAGCISGVGDSGIPFSVAWRVHDAQFWGVPQRRKRIALVADFGGLSAPEILFERKGLRGCAEPRGASRESPTAGTEGSLDEAGEISDDAICLQGNGIDRADTAGCNGRGWRRGGSYTLNTIDRPAVYGGGLPQRNGEREVERDAASKNERRDESEPCERSPRAMNPWDSQSERIYKNDGTWHSLNANNKGGGGRAATPFSHFVKQAIRRTQKIRKDMRKQTPPIR